MALLRVLTFNILAGLVMSCSVTNNVKMTFYGFPDNDPPGPGTAYDCGGRSNIAAEMDTYGDPLTFASARDEYAPCEVIYIPYLQKYLRMEDHCEECRKCSFLL